MKTEAILFTIDRFHIGGVTTFVKQYSQVLMETTKYQVVIIGLKGDIDNPEAFFPGAKVVVVNGFAKNGIFGKSLDFIKYYQTLNLVYKNFRINIIHMSTTWSSFYVLLHYKTHRVKKVITFYGAYDLEVKSLFHRNSGLIDFFMIKIKLSLMRWMQSFTLSSSDRIITFSKFAAALIVDHFSQSLAKKISVIPGYVEKSKIQIKIRKSKTPLLLSIGRIEPRKGIDLLIESVAILIRQGFKLKLLIASPVEYWNLGGILTKYENLNMLFNIQFVHKLNEEQKKQFFAKADLFIIPSREYETFGMTILESMRHGVPVIGTKVGAIPEILSKFNTNFIIEDYSADLLADKIKWYLKQTEVQKSEHKLKCIEITNKFYSKKKISPLIMQAYFS